MWLIEIKDYYFMEYFFKSLYGQSALRDPICDIATGPQESGIFPWCGPKLNQFPQVGVN